MQRELTDILRGTSRRLALTRAVESGVVVAAGAALPCAMLQAAIIVAGTMPTAAIILRLSPLIPAVVFSRPAVWRLLRWSRSEALTAAALSLLVGWAGVLGFDAFTNGSISAAVPPLVILPAGFVAGALGVLLRGASVRQAAVFLDEAAGLSERLATACESAEKRDDSPAAKAVRAQAMTALSLPGVRDAPMWRRGRATAGALVLAVMFCASVAFLPLLRRAGERLTPETVASALDEMSPDTVRRLVLALRRAADLAARHPALARRLFRAARAAEVRNDARLEELLRQLEKSGVDLAKLIPPDVQRAAGLGDDEPLARSPGSPAGSHGTERQAAPNAAAAPAGRTIRVYAPAGTPTGGADSTEAAAGGFIPFADAWSRTRARAADALSHGQVPPEYRRLVRDFFLTGR